MYYSLGLAKTCLKKISTMDITHYQCEVPLRCWLYILWKSSVLWSPYPWCHNLPVLQWRNLLYELIKCIDYDSPLLPPPPFIEAVLKLLCTKKDVWMEKVEGKDRHSQHSQWVHMSCHSTLLTPLHQEITAVGVGSAMFLKKISTMDTTHCSSWKSF